MLSPEARALLNIAILPMPGCKYDEDHDTLLDCNVKVRDLFVDEESYRENKEHVDLCRLSKDMAGVWKGGGTHVFGGTFATFTFFGLTSFTSRNTPLYYLTVEDHSLSFMPPLALFWFHGCRNPAGLNLLCEGTEW
jgi:hypothetical protein